MYKRQVLLWMFGIIYAVYIIVFGFNIPNHNFTSNHFCRFNFQICEVGLDRVPPIGHGRHMYKVVFPPDGFA